MEAIEEEIYKTSDFRGIRIYKDCVRVPNMNKRITAKKLLIRQNGGKYQGITNDSDADELIFPAIDGSGEILEDDEYVSVGGSHAFVVDKYGNIKENSNKKCQISKQTYVDVGKGFWVCPVHLIECKRGDY